MKDGFYDRMYLTLQETTTLFSKVYLYHFTFPPEIYRISLLSLALGIVSIFNLATLIGVMESAVVSFVLV